MSTAEIVPIGSGSDIVTAGIQLVHEVREFLRTATTTAQALDVHARVQAARAWAKVHNVLRDLRVQLLTAEVECLVKVYQLGGASLLTTKEKEAAAWLAEMSIDTRTSMLRESGASITTATGVHRWHIRITALEYEKFKAKGRGRQDASDPPKPPRERRRPTPEVNEVLAALLNGWVETGAPVDLDTVAEDLVAAVDSVSMDPAYVAGVRAVVQVALRTVEPERVEGTVIPRLIVVETQDGIIRIPTRSATVAHLQQWLEFHDDQVDAAQEARARARQFVNQIRSYNSDPDAKVGDVIAASLGGAA